MEFSEYLVQFNKILKKEQPNEEKLTVENYLSTFAALPPFVNETKKCISLAETFRTEGNNMFGNGEFEEAILMYTWSLSKAPPYSKCAALAYANRSAASYRLKAWDECILDINRALNLPYPNELRDKIIVRKAAAVDNKSMDTVQIETDTLVDKLKSVHGENDKLPGVSRGIDIKYSHNKKRNLVAVMPFVTGDVLMVQNPFMAVMELEEEPKYCHHCLKKSLCLIPCDICTYEVYCSEQCRTEAYDTYHRIECKIQYTLISATPEYRQSLVTQLRCLNILSKQGTDLKGLYHDLEEVDNNSDSEQLGFTEGKFVSNTRKAFLSLISGKETAHNSEGLFLTSYIVSLLRNYTNFFKDNSDIPIVTKLLVRLATAQGMNHFEISYIGRQATKAHAACPLLGLVDHACVNNTIAYTDVNNRIVLHASQNIKPGDKILYNFHNLDVILENVYEKSVQMLQGKRVCLICQTTVLYPPQKCPLTKMDKKLRAKLKKNPYDIEGLWKLVNILNETLGPSTLQTTMIKLSLSNAYEGRFDFTYAHKAYHMLGIQ